MHFSDSVKDIRKRRNIVLLWFPIGAIADIVIIELYKAIIGVPPHWLFILVNIGWVAVYFVLAMRISKILCPECKESALRSQPWISMKNLRCHRCGYRFK